MTNGFEFKKLSPELFSEQEKYNHRILQINRKSNIVKNDFWSIKLSNNRRDILTYISRLWAGNKKKRESEKKISKLNKENRNYFIKYIKSKISIDKYNKYNKKTLFERTKRKKNWITKSVETVIICWAFLDIFTGAGVCLWECQREVSCGEQGLSEWAFGHTWRLRWPVERYSADTGRRIRPICLSQVRISVHGELWGALHGRRLRRLVWLGETTAPGTTMQPPLRQSVRPSLHPSPPTKKRAQKRPKKRGVPR